MFSNCLNLEAVYITDLAAWCNIDFSNALSNPLAIAETLYGADNEPIVSLDIPRGVEKIKDFAFYNCGSIESVNIPQSVTAIGICAFEDCKKLNDLSIPKSVTEIGKWAFDGCSGLESITVEPRRNFVR